MNLVTNQIFHIYNRGNQRQPIFFKREHYLYFLFKVRQYLRPYCSILAYCLMPNHFHLLIHTDERSVAPAAALRVRGNPPTVDMNNFSHGMKMLLSSYTKAVNKQLGLSGSLFTQNTKSKQVSSELAREDYTLVCFNYIHQNPYASALVKNPADWEFSSFSDYAGLRAGTLCNMQLAKQIFLLEWQAFEQETMRQIPAERLLKVW